MRYFTRGWANGELSDEERTRSRSAYSSRVDEITPLLPPSMVRLAREIALHDAVIDSIRWSPTQRRLTLKLACLDAQERYFGVELLYGGAMLGAQRLDALRRVARDRQTRLLYDEVDIDTDGVLAHRVLFWPSEEVTIEFKSLDVVTWPRTDALVNLGPGFCEES